MHTVQDHQSTKSGENRQSTAPPVVEFEAVSKIYSRTSRAFFLSDLSARVRKRKQGASTEPFFAVNDVSFSLVAGESLAVVGPNGAGKSTVLGMVAGVSYPDRGRVRVKGSVAALLELGSGFHYDLTGAENLVLNGSLLGLTRRQTRERFDSIVEFSGLSDFIDQPLRTYSTGMVMRLAFSVAVHVDPDILVIDEAFAVGDQEFQAKCAEKIFEFRKAGKTLLCVSHSTGILQRLCDKGLWLDHGKVVMRGTAREVIEAYETGVK